MYSTPNEALIAPSYLMISAIFIWAVIVCSKRKELTVEPTQPSLRENSKISVFNRDGETDIEMPSHSHKVKELEKNRKSDERESSKVKKLDGKDDPNSNESEKRHPHSGKEKHSRKEVLSVKDDDQDRQMKGKDQKSKNQKQSPEVEGPNHENKGKSTEKRVSWKSEEHRSGNLFFKFSFKFHLKFPTNFPLKIKK
uniref:Uncharacterized protein n=1 Tax=Wuchereria bancrofti TaxID=6293 RepID=A0AAF5RUR9_WUCBA